MKIEIISADNVYELENKVNSFLCDVDDERIIDIKYQGIGNTPAYSTNKPSVMVILKY